VEGLTVGNLVVEYRTAADTTRPLNGFNMTAPPGAVAVLMGPSGSGKTTLLSCIAAILTPTSGTITVGDTNVTALSRTQIVDYRRHHVGVVFQAFNLVPSFTAVENVAAPLLAAGQRWKVARARARELLDEVDLSDRRDRLPGQMSGGQQQRVAIARALAHDPPLLLADEPTAHLDRVQVEGILRLLRRIVTADRVALVATHDDRLLTIADLVIDLGEANAAAAVEEPSL
jgi:putative ABC transport system ATP-binding protein